MSTTDTAHAAPESFIARVLRQAGPGQSSSWERYRVPYEKDMNVISVLQRIAEQGVTAEGRRVAPVAWTPRRLLCTTTR